MNANEREATIKLLSLYRKIFSESKADAETLALYVLVLDSLTFEQIKAAMIRLARTCKFFPKPAEIFEAVDKLTTEVNHNRKLYAGEAWGEAMCFIRKIGPYSSEKFNFSCAEVKTAIDIFGKDTLYAMPSVSVGVYRAQFMKIYNEVLEKEKEAKENKAVINQLNQQRIQHLVSHALSNNKNQKGVR